MILKNKNFSMLKVGFILPNNAFFIKLFVFVLLLNKVIEQTITHEEELYRLRDKFLKWQMIWT